MVSLKITKFNYSYKSINLTYKRMQNLTNKITLRHLHGFVTLAETGSFSKAAEQLAVTQPALSASIKQLENQFGTKLFDRTTHQIELTSHGAMVLEYARHLHTTAINTFDDIRRAIGTGRHRIRVGAIPSAMALTAAVVARYGRRHGEEVEVVLADMPNNELLDALHTGALDFCVGIKPPDSESASLDTVTLFEDELVLIVPQGHPLAQSSEVQWWQTAGSEIVLFTQGSIWEFASVALRQHGLAPSKLYNVVYSESLYGIVRAGLALGIMPSLYTTYLKDSALQVIPLRSPTLKREIVLMRRNEVARSVWTDHCFTELRNDLKEVNHWF
jgi:DNA-binding transcriptional LysR family regulator